MRNLPDPVINEQTATPASSVAGFALTWDLSSLTVAVGPGDVGGQEVFTGGTVSLPATVPTANATSPGWPEIDACGVSGSAAYTVGIYNDANPVPTSTPAGYAADTCVPLASVAEDVIDGITGQQWVESTPTWFSMEYQPTTALTSGAVSSPTSSAAAPS